MRPFQSFRQHCFDVFGGAGEVSSHMRCGVFHLLHREKCGLSEDDIERTR